MADTNYVLMTAARNESEYIEDAIRSVVEQRVLPLRWVIVSDGSNDGTDEIVQRYAAKCPWLELLRVDEKHERHFAAKAHCLELAEKQLRNLNYRYIGNIDADIAFGPDYFSFLLGRLENNAQLGVAGTPFEEEGSQVYNYQYTSIEHVSGACQLFRRECYEAVGGYAPIPGGGEDWIAVTTARMLGWETRCFTEMRFRHARPMGTGGSGRYSAWYRLGVRDYCLGWHPVWELCRAAYQMTKRPFVLRGMLILSGYLLSLARKTKRSIPPELMAFHRKEQLARLRQGARRFLGGKTR